jgi:hypothetical protein
MALEHVWPTERLSYGKLIEIPAHVDELVEDGVTHILNVCDNDKANVLIDGWISKVPVHRPIYVYAPGTDESVYTDPYWRNVILTLGADLMCYRDPRRAPSKLYVHCSAGLNRSPWACYLILQELGIRHVDALMMIRRDRPAALCNEWFSKYVEKGNQP